MQANSTAPINYCKQFDMGGIIFIGIFKKLIILWYQRGTFNSIIYMLDYIYNECFTD